MTLQELFSNPTFFDVFGIPIFTFITIISVWMLKTKKLPDKRVLYLLMIIGVLGLIVDGSLVIIAKTLFLGGR